MVEPTEFYGPVFVMDMPLNAEGHGPADPEDTVLTRFEVWDQICHCICVCMNRGDAELIADLLNIHVQVGGTP